MKRKIISLITFTILCIIGCKNTGNSAINSPKKEMVKVTLLYPNGDNSSFDMDYYTNRHMPMVANLLGGSLKFYEIDKGVAGRTPEDPVPYMAIGYLYFDQLSDYQESFGPVAEQIVNDIPNYTNVQPMVQISQVVE